MKPTNDIKTLEAFKKYAKGKDIELILGEVEYGVSYTRVSSREQMEQGGSLESQAKMCLTLAKNSGIQVLETFGGTFESAKTEERKEFQRMMKFISTSRLKIKYILVADNDRFSRTGGNAIYLASQLRKRGVQILAASSPVNTLSPIGAFQQDIQLLFSHFDNQMRREKTVRGMKQKLLKGEYIGRPPLGYNMEYIDNTYKFTINGDGRLLAKAFEWKAYKGYSTKKIAYKLNKLGLSISAKGLSPVFRRIFYCGLLSNKMIGGTIIEGKNWEPLVSKETFLKANDVLSSMRPKYHPREEDNFYPLRGKIHCAKCKALMTGYLVKNRGIHYYKCNTRGCSSNKNASKMHEQLKILLSRFAIDKELSSIIKNYLIEEIQYVLNESKEIKVDVESKITDLKQKIEKLEKRFLNEEIDKQFYDKYRSIFVAELNEIVGENEESEKQLSNIEKILEKCFDYCENINKIWASSDSDDKHKLIKIIFKDKIYYNKDKSEYLTFEKNSIIEYISEGARLLEGCEIKNPPNILEDSLLVAGG